MVEAVNAGSKSIAAMPTIARGQSRIMLVDDEVTNREVLARFLQMHGYRVDAFADGLEAWQALSEAPKDWDLLVTDLNMPGLNGEQLTAKALALRPELPVIICSGYLAWHDGGNQQKRGIFALLNKPLDCTTFLQSVASALGYGETGER